MVSSCQQYRFMLPCQVRLTFVRPWRSASAPLVGRAPPAPPCFPPCGRSLRLSRAGRAPLPRGVPLPSACSAPAVHSGGTLLRFPAVVRCAFFRARRGRFLAHCALRACVGLRVPAWPLVCSPALHSPLSCRCLFILRRVAADWAASPPFVRASRVPSIPSDVRFRAASLCVSESVKLAL